jgi:hypothetical protein
MSSSRSTSNHHDNDDDHDDDDVHHQDEKDNHTTADDQAGDEEDDSSSSSSSSSIDPVLSLSPVVTKSLRTTASQRAIALPLPKTPDRPTSPPAALVRRVSRSNSNSSSSCSTPLATIELPVHHDDDDDAASGVAAARGDTNDQNDDNDNNDDDDDGDVVPTAMLPEPDSDVVHTDSDPSPAIDQAPESASSSTSSLPALAGINAAAPNVPAPRPTVDAEDLFAAVSPFQASEDSELSLVVADLVHVTNRADTGWWFAVKCDDGSKGWLPATHVRPTTTDERERALAALAELKPTRRRRKKPTTAATTTATTTTTENTSDSSTIASQLAALPAPTTRSPQPPEKKKPIDRARRALNRLSRSLSPHSIDTGGSSATTASSSPTASTPSPTLVRASDSPTIPATTASRKSELLGTIKRAIAGKFNNDVAAAAADVEVSEPRFQEHRSHIGVSQEGKFEWDNVPDQWKSLFTSVTRSRLGNSSRDERRPMTMSLDLDDLAAITATASSDLAKNSGSVPASADAAPPADAEPESRQLAETLAEARRLAALRTAEAANGDDDESSDI